MPVNTVSGYERQKFLSEQKPEPAEFSSFMTYGVTLKEKIELMLEWKYRLFNIPISDDGVVHVQLNFGK